MNDEKPNRTKAPRIKNPARYRLEFIKENTLNTVWSVRMTRARVWIVTAASIAAVLALFWTVIAFTPLRQLLPGALHGDLRARYLDASFRLDSLEQAAKLNEAYMANIINVMSGQLTTVESETAERVSIPDSLLLASEEEKQFVRSYEEEERFNLSVLAPIAAEGMIFSSPVPMAEKPQAQQGGKAVEFRGGVAMPAVAVYRGTIVSSTVRSDGLSTVVVQHPNDFVSVYDGISEPYVERGDKVEQAQRIGVVAPKSVMTFELWHKGSPLKPDDYIAL